MKEFWDKRYADEEMAYGEEPNKYFKSQLAKLEAGQLLLPAEGEGRNAVYAATQGWSVDAFDISEEGKKKAIALSGKCNVVIDYKVGGFDKVSYPKNYFDCIGLIYAHFPPHLRSEYHKILDGYLKKDGIIILEGFSKKQIDLNTSNKKAGGPKNAAVLFSKEEITQDFSNYEIIELSEQEIDLNEGIYHNGKSAVIRFVGRKK